MLEALKDKFTNRVLEFEMRGVFGNQAGIRAEKKSRVVQMLEFVWPEVQAAVEREVSVVTDAVARAEQDVRVAQENVKLSDAQVVAACEAIEAAHIHAVDAQNAATRAEANLLSARSEFSALMERIRG